MDGWLACPDHRIAAVRSTRDALSEGSVYGPCVEPVTIVDRMMELVNYEGMPLARRAAIAATLFVAGSVMTGCVQSQGCPGWAGYETPEDASDAADAVAVGHVDELVSTVQLYGATANVWSFEVDDWLTGRGPDRIEILSPPSACGQSDDPYFGVDPFQSARDHATSVAFLSGHDGEWMAINPSQGVIEVSGNLELPAAWPRPAD